MVNIKISMRNNLLSRFQALFPDMPPYVLKTLVYENFHKKPKEVTKFQNHLEQSLWKNETIKITMDQLTPQTQLSLRMRRHLLQKKEIRKNKFKHDVKYLYMKYEAVPYPEPLIISKRPDGYEIYSGWHQTVLSFDLWPEGFEQDCWVEYNPLFKS